MKTYLVGGAVRDELLGYPVHERDRVVVGATPQELLDAGFTQVGKDFPVFLHPDTKEEHALARTERKSGRGYTGFTVHAAPDITLEEDLERRDLTVNAMARDDDGRLIDPYGGQRDLEARVLRHVSPAFVEDPLRVLRVARFAARYAHLGFQVADETLDLMHAIVRQGELAHLPQERIWVETERALGERDPQIYIDTLRRCTALAALIPEVDALFGVPQKAEHHPEVDTGIHVLMVLERAAFLSRAPSAMPSINPARVVFAALLHDLGKGVTPEDVLPGHRGHEHAGLPLVFAACERLKAPKAFRQLALTVCEHHLNGHRARELRAVTVQKVLEATGALRDEIAFEEFLVACEADSRGRKGYENRDYPQAAYLRAARAAALSVRAADVRTPDLQGPAIGEALRAERIRRIAALKPDAPQGL